MIKEKNEIKQNNWFLLDYFQDRKAAIFLFLATSAIFIVVCCLYQMEHLIKLLYCFILSAFVWICYGVADYRNYVKKNQFIRIAGEHLEQAAEVLQKNQTEQISRLESAYEELIGSLNDAHYLAQSEEERKSSERNEYYLMWAHQIKTPIAAMKLLLNDREDSFALLEELFKIEQYVEMVLHYLRLESMSSDLELREYDLYSIVKQAVKKYSVLFINSGLTLKLEEFDEKVLTDEKWLSLVLEQVVSNSVKYTRKGSVFIYMQPDAKHTLVIEDTGMGIRPEDLPRIFERGFTGLNGRMDKKSTGIGLYLCKQVMNRLSHGITVTSQEGKGTRVYLDLSRHI